MLEDLHTTISGFQVALAKFWKDYLATPPPADAYDLKTAQAAQDKQNATLGHVLKMQKHAWGITSSLNSYTLKSLNEKES